MLGSPNDFHEENCSFSAFKKNGLRTDHPSDGPTDRPSYRDARTHLKTMLNFFPLSKIMSPTFSVSDFFACYVTRYSALLVHHLGHVSNDDFKHVCSRGTFFHREHIFINFNCPTREWAKRMSELVNGASEALRSRLCRRAVMWLPMSYFSITLWARLQRLRNFWRGSRNGLWRKNYA